MNRPPDSVGRAAGSSVTIGGILDDRRLEAMPARLSDEYTYYSDYLNAALDEAPP